MSKEPFDYSLFHVHQFEYLEESIWLKSNKNSCNHYERENILNIFLDLYYVLIINIDTDNHYGKKRFHKNTQSCRVIDSSKSSLNESYSYNERLDMDQQSHEFWDNL